MSTRDIGSIWIKKKDSLVLAVPSAIVPIETNFLINPQHPDFPKLEIGNAMEFDFDPRLHKK